MLLVSGCMHRSCADYTLLHHIEDSAISPDTDREHWESLHKHKIPKSESKKLETKKKLMKKWQSLEKKKDDYSPHSFGQVAHVTQPGLLKVSLSYNNKAIPVLELFH